MCLSPREPTPKLWAQVVPTYPFVLNPVHRRRVRDGSLGLSEDNMAMKSGWQDVSRCAAYTKNKNSVE